MSVYVPSKYLLGSLALSSLSGSSVRLGFRRLILLGTPPNRSSAIFCSRAAERATSFCNNDQANSRYKRLQY